jgi:hypothetical protein
VYVLLSTHGVTMQGTVLGFMSEGVKG